ncbi:uncharacterized protein LOC133063178 isoform X2 [Dama dama]|uniref:uncharacterized protein LOC133063178 isoform X2 n=1 Tax=Dama dama TaxID=30532 RepID=UPI002A35F180|nr:uncharacterized protein LOC133063178 isoform X2 [Dama dama]
MACSAAQSVETMLCPVVRPGLSDGRQPHLNPERVVPAHHPPQALGLNIDQAHRGGQEVILKQVSCILAGRGAARFCKPPEPGFYSVAAPARPGCSHPGWGSPEGPAYHPREHYLTLRNHQDSVLLALRHGASLVPVYPFGENDVFRVKAYAPDSWQCLFQVTFKKFLGISPCTFWGRGGLFSAKSWGLVPLARPITIVGECLSPGKKGAHQLGRQPRPSQHLCPRSLQWAAPSRCPSAGSPPRSRWTTITGST